MLGGSRSMKPIINSCHSKLLGAIKVKLLSEVVKDKNIAFIQETKTVYMIGIPVSTKIISRPFSLKDALESYVK
jgi:hypothetical protein